MSILNIEQSFILYQTFTQLRLFVFHAIASLILLAHAQTNFPPVIIFRMLYNKTVKFFITMVLTAFAIPPCMLMLKDYSTFSALFSVLIFREFKMWFFYCFNVNSSLVNTW